MVATSDREPDAPGPTPTATLELRGIRKWFGAVRALDDVDLVLRPGSVHALVGELTVVQQTLGVPAAPDQRLVLATAVPGSPSDVALRLLAQATGPSPESARRRASV